MPTAAEQPVIVDATDEEIDAVIAEFDGDQRQVILALLHDLAEMARDSEASVSKGFVRGNVWRLKLPGSA